MHESEDVVTTKRKRIYGTSVYPNEESFIQKKKFFFFFSLNSLLLHPSNVRHPKRSCYYINTRAGGKNEFYFVIVRWSKDDDIEGNGGFSGTVPSEGRPKKGIQ